MNSKPFEMRNLIAHAVQRSSPELFHPKGSRKTLGLRKVFGSFEKRRNYFLSFTFHANSWRRVIVYTSNTMATLSHGCKPRSLTNKTVFPLIYALRAVIIYNNHTILIGTVFLHVPHMQQKWISHSKETSNHIISPETCILEEVREICWNLLKSLKNRSKTGKGGLFLFERRIYQGSRIQYYIVLPFLFVCFFFTILSCMIKFF